MCLVALGRVPAHYRALSLLSTAPVQLLSHRSQSQHSISITKSSERRKRLYSSRDCVGSGFSNTYTPGNPTGPLFKRPVTNNPTASPSYAHYSALDEELNPRPNSTRGSNGRSGSIKGSALSPRTIKKHLDDYVIGQERAKTVISVAVFNHYLRAQSIEDRKIRIRKELDTRLRRDAAPFQHPIYPEERDAMMREFNAGKLMTCAYRIV